MWIFGVAVWVWFGVLAFYINFWVLDDHEPAGGFVSIFLALIGPIGLLIAATGLVEQETSWRKSQKARLKLHMRFLQADLDETSTNADVSGKHPWAEESKGAFPVLQDDRIQLAAVPKGSVC